MSIVTVTCLSDTHGKCRKLNENMYIQSGDILIHAGDFSAFGNTQELISFNNWLGTLNFKHKIVIAGNHDRVAYLLPREELKTMFTNATYLQDEEVEIEGLRIYGSPWTPRFGNWYFMLSRGPEIEAKWDMIPDGVDIVVTHGPTAGRVDFSRDGVYVGCTSLRNRLDIVKPKLHVCGHIHEAYGETTNGTTLFANVSTCNELYEPVNAPLVYAFCGKELLH